MKTETHIIRDIIGGHLDGRDKVQQTHEPTIPPVAVTMCGRRLVVRNRQRIERFGVGSTDLLCTECVASLPLVEG